MIRYWISSLKTTKASHLLHHIIIGVLLGVLSCAVFNREHMSCFRSEKALLNKAIRSSNIFKEMKNENPGIPDDYRADLPTASDPLSGKDGILLEPTKIITYLRESHSNDYYMVFLIPLSTRLCKKRFYTRRSWSLVSEIEGKKMGYLFLVDKGHSLAHTKLLAQENQMYGDILQTGLVRTEKNYSSSIILAGFQWALEHIGTRSKFYVSVAADIFVDIANVYEYVMNVEKRKAQDLIHCGYHMTSAHLKPRNPASSYYVQDEIYSKDAFPSYCTSDMVILSSRLLTKFYGVACATKLGAFPDESVYLWGVLREKLRGDGEENLVLAKEYTSEKEFLPLGYQIGYDNAKIARQEIDTLWDRVQKQLVTEDEPKKGTGHATRRAKIATLPTTEGHSPAKDMKDLMYKWSRIRDF